MEMDNLLRAAALVSILVAGSCSVNDHMISEDGARNHPIAVEPSFRELKVQFAGGPEGMNADDAVKFDAFLADYRVHGNGSLGISVPGGAPSRAAITYFAERAAATLKELGYDVEYYLWVGIFAPKGTPPAIVTTLRTTIGTAVHSQAFLDALKNAGQELAYLDGPAFQKFWDIDGKRTDEAVISIGKQG